MSLVIIINGSGTSGKDTVAHIVDRHVNNTFVYNISSIDKVREAARILGWTGEKLDHDREFLHQLKMLATKFYDHSLFYMLESHDKYKKTYKNNLLGKMMIGFFHIREPEEIEKFKIEILKRGDRVLTLLITRDNITKFANEADKNVGEYQYGYVIDNSGTIEELKEKVVNLFNKILNGE